ncbi:MAG: hypothetical protein WD492_11935 [Alkalispirochaeta sp.]
MDETQCDGWEGTERVSRIAEQGAVEPILLELRRDNVSLFHGPDAKRDIRAPHPLFSIRFAPG